MVKLASARENRMYGTMLGGNRAKYINTGLYVFATIVLIGLGGFAFVLGYLFLFLQEVKGYGYYKLEKLGFNMLIAGPVLWPGSSWAGPSWGTAIGKKLGVDGHLWKCFTINWGINKCGKVSKMRQIDGLRLKKLRGGAQGRLMHQKEGQLPLIAEEQWRRQRVIEETKAVPVPVPVPVPTSYKDVLLGQT
ncbi:hypothetical protein GH714_028363 [Hevea brasiliensis]|uniref:Uncharacterized protein n=1 Tax=Hevea brasiliensis TaxID=3981 RepID=A0A6A6MJH8_HEVBR|nr:hypothetical protein GH714_028363 [Hevea brasiliensis]